MDTYTRFSLFLLFDFDGGGGPRSSLGIAILLLWPCCDCPAGEFAIMTAVMEPENNAASQRLVKVLFRVLSYRVCPVYNEEGT